MEHTNLAHIEPHKVIIGDKLFKKTFAKSVSNEEYNKTLKEDLNNFAKNTSDELSDLKGKDTNILVEINNIQPKNKGLYKIISIIKK